MMNSNFRWLLLTVFFDVVRVLISSEKIHVSEFPYFGDFWTLKRHPQIVEDFMRDSGNCWPSLGCFTIFRKVPKFSEMFLADFKDFLGRFQGCFGQISEINHIALFLTIMDIDD